MAPQSFALCGLCFRKKKDSQRKDQISRSLPAPTGAPQPFKVHGAPAPVAPPALAAPDRSPNGLEPCLLAELCASPFRSAALGFVQCDDKADELKAPDVADMVLRAGSTAPTPRSPAGLTAGGNIPWAHDHLEGHILPAGLDISTLQQLIDTAASLAAGPAYAHATDTTTTSGNGLAYMLPTTAATAGTNSLTSPSACGTMGAMGTGTGCGTVGTVGLAMASLVAAAGAAGPSTVSTAPYTLEDSNPHHQHPHGGGGQQRALSLVAVFGPFTASGGATGAASRAGLQSCGTVRTVTEHTAAAAAAAMLTTSTSSVSAPYGVATVAGSNSVLRPFGAAGGLGATMTTSGTCDDTAAALAAIVSGGAVMSGASPVAPEASVLAREHQQLLLRLCEPEELTSDLTGLSVIGQGSQSVAFQALWRGARVVVKFSACASLDTSSSYSVVRQALVSKALSHPNVIQHYSVRCCQLLGWSAHFMTPTSQRSASELPALASAKAASTHRTPPARVAGSAGAGSGTAGLGQTRPPPEPVTARRLSGDVANPADGATGTVAAKEGAPPATAPAAAAGMQQAEAATADKAQAGCAAHGASDASVAPVRISHSSQRFLAAGGSAAALIVAGYTAGDATGDAAPMVATEQVDSACAAAAAPADGSSTVATTITLAPFLSPLVMSSAAVQHGGGSAGSAIGASAGATAAASAAAVRFSSLFGSFKSRQQVQLQPTAAAGSAGPAPGSILSTAGCCARRLQPPLSPLPPVNFSAPSPGADAAADSTELHRLPSCSNSTAVLEDSLMGAAHQQHHQHQQAAPAGAVSSAPRLLASSAAPAQPHPPTAGAADAAGTLDTTLMPPLKTRQVACSEPGGAAAPGGESVSSDATTTTLSRQDGHGHGGSGGIFATPFLSGASIGLGSFAAISSSAGTVTQSCELGSTSVMSSPQQPALALGSRAAGLLSGPAPSRHTAGGVVPASRARSQQQPYASQSPPLEVISERDQVLAELGTFPFTGTSLGCGAGDGSSTGKTRSLRAPGSAGSAGMAAAAANASGMGSDAARESPSPLTRRGEAQGQQSGWAGAAWEDAGLSPPPPQEQGPRGQSCLVTSEHVLTKAATAYSDLALTTELPAAVGPCEGMWRSRSTTANNSSSCAGAMVSGPAGIQQFPQAAALVPPLPDVTAGAGVSRRQQQPEAVAAEGTTTGTSFAVGSSHVDNEPPPSETATPETLKQLPSPVTARANDHSASPVAAAALAALAPSRPATAAMPATKNLAQPVVAATAAPAAAAKTPASGKGPAAPGIPGGASPASLSFNSYEGFGNPYDGSDKHSLSLSHVAALLSARQGEYLTAVLMEHADKSTLQAAVQRGLFKENRVWSSRVALRALLRTALEVCFALQHLHSRSVVHGALRPANVLLKSSNLDRRGFTVKVANFSLARVCCGRSIEDNVMQPFGLASVATAEAAAAAVAAGGRMRPLRCSEGKPLGGTSSPETSLEDSRTMGAGVTGGAGGDETSTPRKMSRATANALPFWAPEQLCGVVGKASDVYAFGVLMYVMCVGNLPYAGVPVEEVVTGVANGSLRPSWPDSPPTIEQGLAPQVRQLCTQCWQHDPRARPPFSALCAALQAIENSVRQQLRSAPPPQPQQPANYATTSAFSGSALSPATAAGGGLRPLPATAAANLASPQPQLHQGQQQSSTVSGNALSGTSASKTGTTVSVSAAGAGAATSTSAHISGRAGTAAPGTSPLGQSGNTTTGSLSSGGGTAPRNPVGLTSSPPTTVAEAVAGGMCVVRKGGSNDAASRRRGGSTRGSSVAVGTLGEMQCS